MLLASALGALGLWAMAGPAHAATPFTTGTGTDPSVAVGADGTGHVVWATPNPTSVGYCRVSAGAEACNRTELLAFGGSNPQTTGRPVVFTPAPNKVVIVAGCWNCGAGGGLTNRTYMWTSLNNGDAFASPVEIGRTMETNGTGVWLEDAGIFVGVNGSRAKAADLTAGTGVQYASGSLFVYGPDVARVPGTQKLVAATNDLDVVQYGVFKGPALTAPNVNNVVNWNINQPLSAAEGDNSESDLSSGPNGVYLTYQYFVVNDNRIGLRRFDPTTDTFGAATYVEGPDAIDNNGLAYPDSFQDPNGRLHVAWRSLHGGGRLRYTVSDTSGANFSAAANLAAQESFVDPKVGAGADGKGFAVWTNGTVGNVRIVALDPQAEPVTPPPGGGGGTIPPGGGGGTTPPPGGGLPIGPTFDPKISLTGPGNSATATIVGRRIKVRMRGAITLPAGASRAIACKGKIRLKIKKGKRTMANRKAKLKFKRGKCRFAKTIFLTRSKVGKTRALRLQVRFRGNAVLKAGSTTKTLVIKK
jgi:hypothetical protein